VTAIHVRNKDTGSSGVIPAEAGVRVTATVQPQSGDQVKKVLLVKDRFGISNEAYHEISMLNEHLPRSCKITKETKQINDQWEISPIPGDCTGAEQSLKQRLSERIRNLIRVDESSSIKQSHKVRVKLTGDGTYIGTRQHIVTFGFTLLDEGASARSPNGNYTVCIFRAPESYESMSICLQNVIKDIEVISKEGIEVDDETFEVDFYLGADWKFLATVCGIESPNCTHACIWCTCPKKDRYNGEKEWSLTDTSKGARTVESISVGSKLSAKSKKFKCMSPAFSHGTDFKSGDRQSSSISTDNR
jgi:hypothetical protein